MANYIVSSNDPGKMGGSKAKEDIIKFTSQKGFRSYKINPYLPNKLTKFYYVHFKLQKFFRNSINDVIMQYPIPSEYIVEKFVFELKRKIHGNFIIWIHDIQGLQSPNVKKLQWEVKLFNSADILVVHNSKMKRWLNLHGVNTLIVVLDMFDYDNPQPIQPKISYERTVCFAGNLFKSGFLKNLNVKTKIYVFGPNMPAQHPTNIIPMGQFPPEEITKHLNQNFGLIWDGPNSKTCQGIFGKYLLYNNPHKTSLYLSSGIPVIIWNQAALADFITANKVGITISNLTELDERLSKISLKEYNEMKNNTDKIAQKLRSGYYTKQVIKKIEKLKKK